MSLASYHLQIVAPYVRARWGGRDETGASLIEYALLLALITLVCIVAIALIPNQSRD